jgi:hypothetical protein
MTPTVATPSAAVNGMAADWALAAALLGGTKAMRAAGKEYLPKWPRETDESYDARLAVSVLFPAYKRTIETLTGKPFSKPITIGDDVPPKIVGWLQNIDLQQRNLDAFASELTEHAMGYGLAGILVEYPRKADDIQTLQQERSAGLRPYLVHIKAQQILGWRCERIAENWELTQLRLMESVEVNDGAYLTAMIEQVRVLTPSAWETYRKDAKGDWMPYESGITSLDYVPFVPVYGKRTGFMTAEPPLLELAHLNVKHWQSQSDQDTILHVARVPVLAVIGVDDDKWTLTVGASAAIRMPMGSEAKYIEHSGKAIEAGEKSLEALKEEMRQAGAELLVIETGQITATQVATENAVGMCALQRITLGVQDCLNTALQYMADWVGLATGGTVQVFNDFGAMSRSEATAQLVKDMAVAGQLSTETAFGEMQRRGVISADLTWKDEQARIESQGPSLGEMVDEQTLDAVGNPKQAADDSSGDPAAGTVTGTPQSAAIDMTPIADAIRSMQQIDLAPLVDAINARQPDTVTLEATIDATPIALAVAEAIKSMPPPVINTAEPAPPFDFAPILAAINARQPDTVVIDADPIGRAVAEAIRSIPQPVMPDINVNNPAPPIQEAIAQPPRDVSFIFNNAGEIVGARIK